MITDNKLKEIVERRKFTNFWEAFDYLKLAGYEETEAMLFACDLFDGDIWGKVVNASKNFINSHSEGGGGNFSFASGTSYVVNFSDSGASGAYSYVGGVDPATIQPDDLKVQLFLMTDKANPNFKSIYKAYVETRKYEENPVLESHIKTISIQLTTELAIKLFNDGYSKLK